MVSLPPFGMASRALTARLMMAISSWFASMLVCHRPADMTVSMEICSPMVRCNRSDMPPTRRLTSSGFGSRGCCRENARSRWVSDAARCAPRMALSTKCSMLAASDPVCLIWRRTVSRLPTMMVRRLLKSCATPPVN